MEKTLEESMRAMRDPSGIVASPFTVWPYINCPCGRAHARMPDGQFGSLYELFNAAKEYRESRHRSATEVLAAGERLDAALKAVQP